MRYFVGFLITVGLIIVLIVLLLTGGGDDSANKAPEQLSDKPKTTSQLAAFADTDAVARMVLEGPIIANQEYTAVRITIGREDVTYEQIQGYEGTVVNTQVYANNQSAYSNFLYAIGRAGFTQGDDDPKLANEKGFCSTGQRYIFELANGARNIQRYWATSCGGGMPKTYKGNLFLTRDLFQAQVPGYNDLVSELDNL